MQREYLRVTPATRPVRVGAYNRKLWQK